MSNDLSTAVIQPVTAELAEAQRNTAGLGQSIYYDPNPMGVAFGDSKSLPLPGAITGRNFSFSNTPPTGGNSITVNVRREFPFYVTSEEMVSLGKNSSSFVNEQLSEAVNEAVQENENAIRNLLDTECGYGVVNKTGSNPFDSTDKLGVFASCRATLGAVNVSKDRSYIFGPNALQRYINLDSANRIDASEDMNLRREGILGREIGFALRETPSSSSFTEGTASGYNTDATASKGDTTISVTGGSDDFVEGDIITISGASYKYVVSSWEPTSGTITLNAPLLEAIGTSKSVTVESSDNRDYCIGKRAVWGIIRPPHVASGDELGRDTTIITDELTGVQMRLSAIPAYGGVQYIISFVRGLAMWVASESIVVGNN